MSDAPQSSRTRSQFGRPAPTIAAVLGPHSRAGLFAASGRAVTDCLPSRSDREEGPTTEGALWAFR